MRVSMLEQEQESEQTPTLIRVLARAALATPPSDKCSRTSPMPASQLAGPMYLTWKQPRLGRVEYQAWFCQQLGLEPPCLAPYAGQHCSCGRFTIDADHLHTCKQHSGNWYAAHERLLTVVEEIVRAAGLRTKRRYVASSRGSRRCDLEVRDANVADKAHLIIDVAMVHEFHGACDDTVAMARLGMRRTPTACSLTLPSGRSATRRFLLPASVTRRCRVRPSLGTSDGGYCSSTPASATSGRRRARVAGGPRCKLGWLIA